MAVRQQKCSWDNKCRRTPDIGTQWKMLHRRAGKYSVRRARRRTPNSHIVSGRKEVTLKSPSAVWVPCSSESTEKARRDYTRYSYFEAGAPSVKTRRHLPLSHAGGFPPRYSYDLPERNIRSQGVANSSARLDNDRAVRGPAPRAHAGGGAIGPYEGFMAGNSREKHAKASTERGRRSIADGRCTLAEEKSKRTRRKYYRYVKISIKQYRHIQNSNRACWSSFWHATTSLPVPRAPPSSSGTCKTHSKPWKPWYQAPPCHMIVYSY